MKRVALPMVNQIVFARDQLLAKLNAVNEGNFAIGIGAATEREDAETNRVMKPHLKELLRARIRQLESDLAEYGVDVLS